MRGRIDKLPRGNRRALQFRPYIFRLNYPDPDSNEWLHAERAPRGAPERLVRIVLKYHGDACFRWPYTYEGCTAKARIGGVYVNVHRYICEAAHGPAPSPTHRATRTCGDILCISPREYPAAWDRCARGWPVVQPQSDCLSLRTRSGARPRG
jgi:hypothetical protein